MRTLGSAALAAIVVFSSGCATITNGRSQELKILTSPPGAQVEIDGLNRGVTPTVAVLRRRGTHEARFTRACYQTTQVAVSGRFRPFKWFLGNLFSWWTVGWITDLATGASWKLKPNPLQVTLIPLDKTTPECQAEIETSLHTVAGALNMLATSERGELRTAAQTLLGAKALSIGQLDRVAQRIFDGRNSDDAVTIDALALLCEIIERSGIGRYRAIMAEIGGGAASRKLRKHAESAADDLPEWIGDDFLVTRNGP